MEIDASDGDGTAIASYSRSHVVEDVLYDARYPVVLIQSPDFYDAKHGNHAKIILALELGASREYSSTTANFESTLFSS